MPALGLKLRLNKITAKIAQIVTSGLVMWHKFTPTPWDGTTNRLPDSSPEGNSAKMYTGTGLSFDGSNDSVTIGDTNQNVKSVVFYVYADTTTEDFMQLQASGAVGIGVASGTLTTTGWTSPTTYVNGASGSTITASTWRHIAVTSATAIDASDVKLGLSNASYFDGSLANVKFFSVELTANQVAELYANPEQIVPTGVGLGDLVGWWYMAEGSISTIVLDASGNNNNGFISGATTTNALVSPVTQLGLLGGSAPMYYDGTNDYVAASASYSFHNYFTLAAWIVPDNQNAGVIYISTDGTSKLAFSLNNTTKTIALSDDSSGEIISTGTYDEYKLNFICVVYDATTYTGTFYINGQSAGTATYGFTPSYGANITGIEVGRFSTNYLKGTFFAGFYTDNLLTADEIAELYAQGIDYDVRNDVGDYVSSANLQGYWRNTGNTNADWVDLSGNGYNGTVNGTPGTIWLPQGKEIGKDVVGMSQKYVNTGQLLYNPTTFTGLVQVSDDNSLDLTTEFTIDFWANLYNSPDSKYIIYKASAYQVYILTNNAIRANFRIGGVSTTILTSTLSCFGQYSHIVLTYDNSNVKLYENGILIETVALTGNVDVTTSALNIGGFNTTLLNSASGFLDSVKLYNTALTADQVLQNYNAEKFKYI